MSQTTIATEILETLDVQLNFASQITFNLEVVLNDLTNITYVDFR